MQYTTYIGLDVHKQFIYATRMTADGHVRRQWRFATTPQALHEFAEKLTTDDAVSLESTTNALPIYHLLAERAGHVVISNPLQTKAIASAKIKTDKVDSEALANLHRTGYLPTVWVPDAATQKLRSMCGYRTALVRQRTQVKNRIHSVLHRNLIPKPDVSDLFGKKGRACLETVELPQHEAFQLTQELVLLDFLNERIGAQDKEIAREAVQGEEVRLLLTLPGFSLQVAVGVWAAIGDIGRFREPRKLVSYLGLDPLSKSSADRVFGSTRISKRGRSHARWLVIEGATSAVRVPGPLQAFYLRLRGKKGHNKAIVAAARKLVHILWHMLTKGEPYAWAPVVQTQEKVRKVEIMAGLPRRKTGPKPGGLSPWGPGGIREARRTQHEPAKLAQARYEEFIRLREREKAVG